MEDWRVIVTPNLPGALNMAMDQTIANLVTIGKSPATLRIYNWQPFCLSLGYHQKIDDINLRTCEDLNIYVVRRPTGGKAVFHANEITYSVIAPFSSNIYQNTIAETYYLLAGWLSKCLQSLGVGTELVPELNSSEKQKLFRNPSCFSTASEYEITVVGKKIVGSAQRRWQGVVLQHGSFLIGAEYQKVVDLLNISMDRRTKMLSYLQQRTICLNELIQSNFSFETLSKTFVKNWQNVFQFNISCEDFTKSEIQEAQFLKNDFEILAVSEYVQTLD